MKIESIFQTKLQPCILLCYQQKQPRSGHPQQISIWTSSLKNFNYRFFVLELNQDEYPNFIYTGIVNKVNTLISYILEYLTGWIP